jgi:hypothetical protein
MQVASLIGCKARSRKPIKDILDEVETQVDCHSALPSTPYLAPHNDLYLENSLGNSAHFPLKLQGSSRLRPPH